jgi:hypothetical protein
MQSVSRYAASALCAAMSDASRAEEVQQRASRALRGFGELSGDRGGAERRSRRTRVLKPDGSDSDR